MTDTFRLHGDYGTTPSGGSCSSAFPTLESVIDERATVSGKMYADYTLVADTVETVDLGGLTDVSVIVIKSDAKVRLRITSSDGATQAIPVDGFIALVTKSVIITAIDLTRVAGAETNVHVFLAELAS